MQYYCAYTWHHDTTLEQVARMVVEDADADGALRTRKLAGILAEAEWSPGSHIAAGHRPPAAPDLHHTIVVEHGNAVRGQPDVALEAGRAQRKGQREGVERVLAGVRTSAPMAERDRTFQQGWQPLLHPPDDDRLTGGSTGPAPDPPVDCGACSTSRAARSS